MRRCEDEQMWRWADVKMSRCEDVKMRKWEVVKMRRCEDEKVRRWEDEKMWRWKDVKMRRCEDEKLWRWEDVKMRRCEDDVQMKKMWRWKDEKMRSCEDEKMWRWEAVKMRRWDTDPHYWKNPALRRSREQKQKQCIATNASSHCRSPMRKILAKKCHNRLVPKLLHVRPDLFQQIHGRDVCRAWNCSACSVLPAQVDHNHILLIPKLWIAWTHQRILKFLGLSLTRAALFWFIYFVKPKHVKPMQNYAKPMPYILYLTWGKITWEIMRESLGTQGLQACGKGDWNKWT